METILNLKIKLIDMLCSNLEKQLDNYKLEMKKAQEEANSHIGAMESRYDTFKEEAQMLKDAFEGQYKIVLDTLSTLESYKNNILLKSNSLNNIVKLGSIVYLSNNEKNEQYFILPKTSYSVLEINKKEYKCLSINTPFVKKIIGLSIDDEIEFNNSLIEIIDII